MDRREFLKSSGLAGAATIGAVASADAPALAIPARNSGTKEFVLAYPAAIEGTELGDTANRIARRIETATAGRYRGTVAASHLSAHESVLTTQADLAIGFEQFHARQHPAFTVFAGLPLGQHLNANAHLAWLEVGGGQMLWDDLAAAHGVKSFAIGHTGSSAGLWSERIIGGARDFAGQHLAVSGIAREVVRALAGTPVEVATCEMHAALASGRLLAAEPTVRPRVPLARYALQPGLMPGGLAISLSLRTSTWEALSAADQAILAGVFAEAQRIGMAEALAGAALGRAVMASTRLPLVSGFDASCRRAITAASADVVSALAATDPVARRIIDSHRAFRRLFNDVDATAGA